MNSISKTRSLGNRTARVRTHNLEVVNLDPHMDYSFRRKQDIEEGGGTDMYGYTPVNSTNSIGETWAMTELGGVKTKGKKQLILQDVILCKRPKSTSQYFKDLEDEKYNNQIRLLKLAGKNVKAKARNLGLSSDEFQITDSSSVQNVLQRPGPTEGYETDIMEEEPNG